jgi:hypothetical protein
VTSVCDNGRTRDALQELTAPAQSTPSAKSTFSCFSLVHRANLEGSNGSTYPVREVSANDRYLREAAAESGKPDDAPRIASHPAHPCPLLRFGLLRQFQSVLYLDTEIANRAFELRVPQEKLHSTQVLGPSVDQRWFRPTDGMGSVRG